MTVTTPYEFGDIVFLKTDKEQQARMITQVRVCADNSVLFSLSLGERTTEHFEVEFTTEENVLTKVK